MAVSGLFLYVLINFFQIETEYGLRSNPIIDEVKLMHNLFNFLFVFSIGLIFTNHILKKFMDKYSKKIISGYLLSISIIMLLPSGILLLYISDLDLREIFTSIHFYLGIGYIVIQLIHITPRKFNL